MIAHTPPAFPLANHPRQEDDHETFPMISAQQLKFRYPRSNFVLDIEDLQIEAGAKVAVVGPSGCGKTTLLNLLAGIELPDQGRVEIDGQCISKLSDSARRNFRIAQIGMVFQQFELIEYLNLKQNILLPFQINTSLKLTKEVEARAVKLAQEMGLGDKLRRRPDQLSQGEKQRCAICRALVVQPKIILADEPTGNLDQANKGVILDLMHDQAKSNGQTLVVVTHDLSILDRMDRTIDFEKFHRSVAEATS